MVEEAASLFDLCSGKALFIVNDRLDVALAVEADGVHIGQEDMPFVIARHLLGPHRIIGLTVHDATEAEEAEHLGADYIGLSPVFHTGTKKDAGEACGVSMVRAVRERVHIPLVAIGGINRDNVTDVIRAGADAACAISAVVCSDDVYGETKTFRELILNTRNGYFRP